ncbi:MAG: ammonium transporter [Lachnospiraceae bacterium]
MDFSIWFLIGAALVFFMQCGFTMVESGFTRAKNAGNIIMKNMMDFCLGTIAFFVIGYNIMLGDTIGGFIGWGLNPIGDFAGTDWSAFVFNLVFCATAATIVSGAVAERTKFASYCIYSVILSALIYPIEAHWVWGGGWLAQMGFIDFAGSAAIHTVGGVAGLIGAIVLGPRIGKYDENGKSQPILGHSITLGALGVFILWFGWYGFNGAAATDITQLGQIFATTTIAPAAATITAMGYTWIKNGKPDVSMSLNGALAGLVAITAGCSNVDCVGAFFIGAIAGVLVVVVVYFIENTLKIDDPVGAVAVHGACGIFGTVAVGLFDYNAGLFYGGGVDLLIIQIIGIVAIIAWTVVTVTIMFVIINKTIGMRASIHEEIEGLDSTEHGLESAYPDFQEKNYKF